MDNRTLYNDIKSESQMSISSSKQTTQSRSATTTNVSYSFCDRKSGREYQSALQKIINEAKELSW